MEELIEKWKLRAKNMPEDNDFMQGMASALIKCSGELEELAKSDELNPKTD